MDKKHLLNESKTFCMLPWLHLYVTPLGDTYPCCSSDYSDPMENVQNKPINEIFNSDEMKDLRLKMLNGEKSSKCKFCYKHEETSTTSFRHYANKLFGKHFDELIPTTQIDGTVPDFKMKYFDVRFSNICNMQCRTCGSEFSSKWAKEMTEHDSEHIPENFRIINKADPSNKLLQDCIDQIDNMDIVYFAGGEPLITEEHYVLLEEMIRKDASKNIILRYNTNTSNFKYKNHDVLELWKNFKKVEIAASIDHYGDRAEYIRNGTDWGEVENNLKLIKDLDYVEYQMNTVLSLFNYVTLAEFFQYMIDKDLLYKEQHISIYRALSPPYYTATILPKELKDIGTNKLKGLKSYLIDNHWWQHSQIQDSIDFVYTTHDWDLNKQEFRNHTAKRDRIRNENFVKTFPELESLMYE